ncbi:putative neuroblastoma breakpoint family member 5 isoform X2 [Zalophus californianus]|uniref:Neuroblastoma breakpoint family member 5 isoform X2 n=1 Tax=Zalophus californianus TaxID=9704 RepID=A0A6P9FI06_ZALCA|nr:putative neuroblastoma breakpoint family member 5 isoform X2 [Zalophus californianus]
MAAPLGPLSDPGAEISLLEINQELQSQLEKSKQDFRDLKEKFLISKATAYSLANQLQKYKCEESTDLIESVLGEKVQFEKGKQADTVAEKLRLCHTLIKDQDKELTRLYQKLRKGKDVSQLLNKLLEDLLTHDDPEHSQGQGFQEQLAEGRRLAKCLARKLSPENYEDEEDEEEQGTLTPSMEQQQVEKKEVLQDTVDECVLTPSTLQEGCDNDQSYSAGEFPLDEQEFGSALDLACECSHTQGDETSRGPPEDRTDQEDLGRQEPAAPRLSRQLVEVVQQDVSRDSQDEHYLTYSVLPDLSDSYWPYRSAAIFLPEELEVCSSLEVTKNQFHHEEEEDQDQACPRFSRELPVVEEQDNPWDSLDECYMISSAFPGLSDPHGNSRRADINSFQNLDICSPLEAAQNHNDLLEEDQDRICPR